MNFQTVESYRRERAVLFTLVILIAIGHTHAEFELCVTGPNDPNFSDSMFFRATFPEFTNILSVSSPVPHLIKGNETGGPELLFRGSLPNCSVPVTVFGKKPNGNIVKYTGNIFLYKIDPSDLNHGIMTVACDDFQDRINDLNTNYTVHVVPHNTSGRLMVIVLRDKISGTVVPQDDALIIIKSYHLNPKKTVCNCTEVCNMVVEHDTSAGMVQTAVVASENRKVFAGMPVKWVQKCGKDLFKVPNAMDCGPRTCYGTGRCNPDISDSSKICTCPGVSKDLRGPRCELLARSYLSTNEFQNITTQHDVHLRTFKQSEVLTFSFEHSGRCNMGAGSLCTILRVVVAKSQQILKVEQGRVTEPRYSTATLPNVPDNKDKMTLFSDRYVQNSRWLDVTVIIERSGFSIKGKAVFCSKEVNPVCFESEATRPFSRDWLEKFNDGKLYFLEEATIEIGGVFNGCFRNVRLNGQLVTLHPTSTTGDASLTKEGCASQQASCSTNGYKFARTCSQDAPIITTGASDTKISWEMRPEVMNQSSYIRLDPKAPLSVKLRVRTAQSNAEMLTLHARSTTGIIGIIKLKLQGDVLSCCVNLDCNAFTPKPVNDGLWHTVTVRLTQTQLHTRIDDREKIHTISLMPVDGFKVTMSLDSSCVSNLRISDIYMPTSDDDATKDSDSATVTMTASSDVRSGGTCGAHFL